MNKTEGLSAQRAVLGETALGALGVNKQRCVHGRLYPLINLFSQIKQPKRAWAVSSYGTQASSASPRARSALTTA